MSYKILKQTDKAFEIQHPDGSKFMVPKKGLSKAMMDKISKLPGFAEGGPVGVKTYPPGYWKRPKSEMAPEDVASREALQAQMERQQWEARTPADVRFPPQIKPYVGQPEVRGTAPAVEEALSPIDFLTPGMVTAPARMVGRGAMAVGKELIEAAPRILANEAGSVGGVAVKPRMVMPGMFSKAEQIVAEKMGGAATPQQVMGILKEAKPEEVEYLKIPQFLEGKDKVSKADLIAHIQENLPKIEEKTLGGKALEESKRIGELKRKADRDLYTAQKDIFKTNPDVMTKLDAKTYGDFEYYSQIGGEGWQNVKNEMFKVAEPSEKQALAAQLEKIEKANKAAIAASNEEFAFTEKYGERLRDMKPAKFASYSTPGGEAYQEKLYTLPNKPFSVRATEEPNKYVVLNNATGQRMTQPMEYGDAVEEFEKIAPAQFKSGHFEEPNILAHARTKEFSTPEGKTMMAEEIQSDWHQAGRSKGYKTEPLPKVEQPPLHSELTPNEVVVIETPVSYLIRPSNTRHFLANNEIRIGKGVGDKDWAKYNALEQLNRKIMEENNSIIRAHEKATRDVRVPDAPMKKTWHEFVSKRLLHDAAESGADSLSWTTGATQAERYNLAKQVDAVLAQKQPDGTFHIVAQKNGQHVTEARNLTHDQLETQLGKDLAKKIVAESGETVGTSGTLKYTGDDLKVGGEGMKGFYDKIIPEYVSKLTKKYGVKPEKRMIPTKDIDPEGFFTAGPKNENEWTVFFHDNADAPKRAVAVAKSKEEAIAIGTQLEKEYLKTATKKEMQEVWNVKITPEMREDILKKGFPLFTGAAAIKSQQAEAKKPEGLYKGGKVEKQMGYRIIKDTDDHYQVLHPDGSRFTVPKKGISKQMMEKISGMPKLFNGDEETQESIPVNLDYGSIGSGTRLAQNMPNDTIPVSINASTSLIPGATPAEVNERLQAKNALESYESAPRFMPKMPYELPQMPTKLPAPMEEEKTEPAPAQAQAPAPEQPQMQTGLPDFSQQPYDAQFQKMQGQYAGLGQKMETAERESRMKMALAGVEADVRQQEMNDYVKAADEEADKFLKENRIDPTRYWSKMDTPNKVLAGISIALGGIGQGLMGPGSRNYALDIINKAIDADIDAQKENRNSAYSALLNRHKRHETALAAAKADALQKAQNSINEFALRSKSLDAQANAQKLWNDLEVQKIALQEAFRKKTAGDYLNRQAANGAMMTPEEIQLLPEDTRKRFINGAGLATTEQSANKIREVKANSDDVETIINRLYDIRKKMGREITPSQARTTAQSLGQILIGKLREPVLGPGTMTDPEYQRLQKVAPKDVTEIMSLDDNVFARLDTLRDVVRNNLDNKYRAEGIMPKARPTKMQSGPEFQQGLILNK